MLVKIHATCEYFFTTANMADVKLETDFVEKRLFAVKKKTTYYTLSLTTNIMCCKLTIMLCIKIPWLLAEVGFQITIRYFTCKLGRMLLASLTVVLK